MELEIGTKGPGFSVEKTSGGVASLEDYEGKWVVIYFYPKDSTPG